jgi:putative addiction module component (TIGR02574 family)
MPLTVDQIREEALSLPDEDRRHLLDSLWDSFGDDDIEGESDDAEFTPEFLAELDRRSAEVENGTAVLIPYEEVKRHMASLLRKAG